MTTPIVWLSYNPDIPPRGYWDMGMIEAMFAHETWRPVGAHEFRHMTSLEGLEGAIIVFPARAQVEYADRLQRDIQHLKWVIVMLTGDEEAKFPFYKLRHPNMRLWVMSPRKHRAYPEGTRFLGTGFPPQARPMIAAGHTADQGKSLDWFFAGQITHERRIKMAEVINNWNEPGMGGFYPSRGFTEGLPPEQYYRDLARAKVGFAPSGPETPDSFRLFEALEAGCIPIADTRVQQGKPNQDFGDDYWTWFFGTEPPFPVLTDYEQLPGYTAEALEHWQLLSNRVSAWWMRQKRKMAYNLETDLAELGVPDREEGTYPPDADMITVLIPTSPIAAHPDTSMIEQTIRDVRAKLPECEIIIMVDGIRAEQEHRRADYEEYTRRLLWLAHHEWHNVIPLVFEQHQHQARMTRAALSHVATPIILFVEHDAPITPDCDFEWRNLTNAIMHGDANVIRFHHEAEVLAAHEHLMLGPVEKIAMPWEQPDFGVPMRKTYQWSQRPHLASVAFYRVMLDHYFHPDSLTMIEDVMHGVLIEAVKKDGIMGWHNFRLWMYHPEGNIKRSYHMDGRGADPKYEMDIKPVEPPK